MLVPKLRFKEFKDEWKIYKFYDIVSITNGQVNPNDELYRNLPHIGPGNIEKETGRLLKYNLAKDDNLISSKYLFDKNAIIYGKINPHFAKVCYPNFIGLCSADAYPITPNNSVLTSEFLLYILLTRKFTKFATSVSMRTGMPKINRDELGSYKFTIPSIQEQEKIGNLISLLDKKINIQFKKIETLKIYKKGLMNKLYNNNHEMEMKKIGNICKIQKGIQLNCENMIDDGKYYVLNGGSKLSGYTNNYNTEGNTITISEGGNSCGFVNYNKEKFWAGGHCYTLKKIDNRINLNYLYQTLKFNEKKIMLLRVGSGLPNIQKATLENFEIYIHSKENQEKISDILGQIDKKIYIEKINKQKLNLLKQGLLQKMFI
ncbi:MAG: type I restriction endonuclease [Clostridia bacterium]|nr:type I restriction endonuclease [Clostridia bacterium]